MIVKAFWKAIKIENAQSPYDTIQLKVFDPASNLDSQQTFSSPANQANTLPVVILYNWLAENIPGNISLTPGVNLAAFSPDVYGIVISNRNQTNCFSCRTDRKAPDYMRTSPSRLRADKSFATSDF